VFSSCGLGFLGWKRMGHRKPVLLYSQQFSYDGEIVGMVGSLAWVRQNKIILIPYLCSIKNFKKNRQGSAEEFKGCCWSFNPKGPLLSDLV
jgi:hypothetical protein